MASSTFQSSSTAAVTASTSSRIPLLSSSPTLIEGDFEFSDEKFAVLPINDEAADIGVESGKDLQEISVVRNISSASTAERPPSLVIFHKIASYLSLGDAESMASISRGSNSVINSSHHSMGCYSPGYPLVDQQIYSSRCSPSSNGNTLNNGHSNSTYGASNSSRLSRGYCSINGGQDVHALQLQQQHFQQTLSSIIDSNDEQDNEYDEGWFLGAGGDNSTVISGISGNRQLSRSNNDTVPALCPVGFGTPSLTFTPLTTTLSPLEEEWEANNYSSCNKSCGGDNKKGQKNRPWTPAGEPTCERNHIGNVTPTPTFASTSQSNCSDSLGESESSRENSSFFIRREHRMRKQALQHKLAAAVFAHPHPLSNYCLDAYATALKLSRKRQRQHQHLMEGGSSMNQGCDNASSSKLRDGNSPECSQDSASCQNSHFYRQQSRRKQISKQQKINRSKILRVVLTNILNSVPLSVLLDLVESIFDLSIDTLFALGKIGSFTLRKCLVTLCNAILFVLDILTNINPFHVFELVINAQRSAMGKTGEVLVSGIHSVATGMGSASNAALNRLSRQGLALAGGVMAAGGTSVAAGLSRSGGGTCGVGGFGRSRWVEGIGENPLESKLFRRLHQMDNVSKLIFYSEIEGEEAFGRAQKRRAQRMMHYNVSFRPFTATIQPCSPKKSEKMKRLVSFDATTLPVESSITEMDRGDDSSDNDSESLYSNTGSIFMRTPTSFPPTPTSRMYYFERGSRFTENVIFLARDQLRVERGLDNSNEQTRAMSKALREGSRLAVFDASSDVGGGILLSCGQHIATKVGNALYCSTRSMIPVMRNSFVYFEISVSPPPVVNDHHHYPSQMDVATLSVGLSTLDMPLNTLVGAWKGSVGLCTTGQILLAGQWFAPVDTSESSYGCNSTVGCLVYLDDNATHNTRDGAMVTADVTFNVNGVVVPSIECSRSTGMSVWDHASIASNSQTMDDDGEDVPTLSLLVPKVHELFPTVTLHSPATCVMCRFNAEDLLADSCSGIGAPKGVTVYSIDGSVIFDSFSETPGSDEFVDSADDFTHDEVAL